MYRTHQDEKHNTLWRIPFIKIGRPHRKEKAKNKTKQKKQKQKEEKKKRKEKKPVNKPTKLKETTHAFKYAGTVPRKNQLKTLTQMKRAGTANN